LKKILIVSIVLIILVIGSIKLFSTKTISVNNLRVSEYTVNNEIIKLKVFCIDSSTVIKDYSYEYKNDSLYLVLKGNSFSSNKKGIDTISIKNTFKKLDNVYLFDGKNTEKIWDQSKK